MSSMQRIHRDSVGARERVKLEGSMAVIMIDGDVGEGAHVYISGSMGQIHIGGYIHARARVCIDGSMGKIFHNGVHESAQIECNGSMGQVIRGAGGGGSFPRPPRPPRPPKPPRAWSSDTWSSGVHSSVSMSGANIGSLRITDEGVWIDGKKVGSPGIDVDEAEKLKDQYPDIPVRIKDGDAKVLTVQKSQRPREQWGT